jgi:hypothetical protein
MTARKITPFTLPPLTASDRTRIAALEAQNAQLVEATRNYTSERAKQLALQARSDLDANPTAENLSRLAEAESTLAYLARHDDEARVSLRRLYAGAWDLVWAHFRGEIAPFVVEILDRDLRVLNEEIDLQRQREASWLTTLAAWQEEAAARYGVGFSFTTTPAAELQGRAAKLRDAIGRVSRFDRADHSKSSAPPPIADLIALGKADVTFDLGNAAGPSLA